MLADDCRTAGAQSRTEAGYRSSLQQEEGGWSGWMDGLLSYILHSYHNECNVFIESLILKSGSCWVNMLICSRSTVTLSPLNLISLFYWICKLENTGAQMSVYDRDDFMNMSAVLFSPWIHISLNSQWRLTNWCMKKRIYWGFRQPRWC